ncbi:MAG: DUF364 domain-containing protein [Halobacteriales archaeon]
MSEPRTAETVLRDLASGLDPDGEPRIRSVTGGIELLLVTSERRDGTTGAGVALNPGGPLPDVTGESTAAVARRGATADDLATRAVGIAALNALSRFEPADRSADPFELLDPAVDRIAMIGLFAPVVPRMGDVEVDVIERDPDSMTVPAETPEHVTVDLHPPEAAESVIPEAGVVYVTGSTFVYGGLQRYLDATDADQSVVVLGATTSFDPTPLFEAGVPVVGGAAVEDLDGVRDGIAEDEQESGLHDRGLRKLLAVDPSVDRHPGLRLET